jgi:hypothetical protein
LDPFLDDGDFFERSNAFGPNHHLVNIQKLIFTHFRTLFVYLPQKKIRSYLDDDDKASLQEKGHLPAKDIHHKISITFAGARFDFAS